MLTNDELQAIRARAEAATPGPWNAVQIMANIWNIQIEKDDFEPVVIGRATMTCCGVGIPDGECPANAALFAHARADIPALLDHIEHLNRSYTMPCPYCDFSGGQRGMDRCPHCDGTGRMALHRFVAQQRDVARTEVEGLRKEVAHQKRALEWLAEQAAYACSHATGCPVHSQACPRGNTRCLDIEGEDWVRKALDATKEAASE